MALKFKAKVDQPAWLKMIRDKQRPVATAAVAALQETAANSVQEGRRNIAGAGKFGPRWQQGLQFRTVDAEVDGEPSLQAKAIIFHRIGFAGVFEFGATIQGKPLLWIPTQHAVPGRPARSAGKRLTSATVRGQPMLFDAADRDRERKPLYIGVPSVRIPKKWRITEIVKDNVAKIALTFIKHFKGD
jgi:Family of unknown function (DUF6441)